MMCQTLKKYDIFWKNIQPGKFDPFDEELEWFFMYQRLSDKEFCLTNMVITKNQVVFVYIFQQQGTHQGQYAVNIA